MVRRSAVCVRVVISSDAPDLVELRNCSTWNGVSI